jgi:ectoine hydroxylase-related dioxygenase (phytanoyl-CoA dioxygenase family)
VVRLVGSRITDVEVQRFRDDGCFVVESLLDRRDVDALRNECQRLVDERDAEMDALGVDRLDLCHRGRRYFPHAYDGSPVVRAFLRSEVMADVARAALGDTAYVFNEQYVVKAADRGSPFAWHQDSGYIPYRHRPYLTCWIPLDDVDETNGTVHVLPFSRAGSRDVVAHHPIEGTTELVGDVGDDPGDAVTAPAGSVVAFSSTVFHRTGPNTTRRPRRVFIAQYSSEPILDEAGLRPRHLAEPVLLGGRRVADPP